MRWLVRAFAALSITAADCSGAAASADPLPRYEHIFLIILENRSYEQNIGNPNAPNINRLAMTSVWPRNSAPRCTRAREITLP